MNEFVHGNLTDASALLDRHACTLSYFLSPALLQYEFCKEGISQSGNTSTIEKLVRIQGQICMTPLITHRSSSPVC